MREPLSIFQRNPSHGLESLFWDFFLDHCHQFSRPSGNHLFHRFSLVLVWMVLDELPKRLSIKSAIYLVKSGFCIALWDDVSGQTTQTDNHEHRGARWEKLRPRSHLDPNISQTFVKAYRDAIEALEPNRRLLPSSWLQMKKRLMWS